jgi:hypothetical protein
VLTKKTIASTSERLNLFFSRFSFPRFDANPKKENFNYQASLARRREP